MWSLSTTVCFHLKKLCHSRKHLYLSSEGWWPEEAAETRKHVLVEIPFQSPRAHSWHFGCPSDPDSVQSALGSPRQGFFLFSLVSHLGAAVPRRQGVEGIPLGEDPVGESSDFRRTGRMLKLALPLRQNGARGILAKGTDEALE